MIADLAWRGRASRGGREKVESNRRMIIRRRGVSLIELAAAGVLLAVILAVCAQFFRATAIQRRGLEARRVAMQEVANLMERLCARPWEEITPESPGPIEPSEEGRKALADGQVEIDVFQPDDEPSAKRITVVLRWQPQPDQPPRSVRLVAWKYRPGSD